MGGVWRVGVGEGLLRIGRVESRVLRDLGLGERGIMRGGLGGLSILQIRGQVVDIVLGDQGILRCHLLVPRVDSELGSLCNSFGYSVWIYKTLPSLIFEFLYKLNASCGAAYAIRQEVLGKLKKSIYSLRVMDEIQANHGRFGKLPLNQEVTGGKVLRPGVDRQVSATRAI